MSLKSIGSLTPATIAAQAGGLLDAGTGGVVPPIHPATTFVRDEDYIPAVDGNVYSRSHAPNGRMAEGVLAQLEGAAEAMVFPSGMAAVAAVFRTLPAGASVLVQSQIYWGTTAWIRGFCARRDITLVEVEAADTDAFAAACATHKPALAWIETPSNPWLRIVDIAACADAVHGAGGLLIADMTTSTPVLTRALSFGADVVMHSATKGLNGHSDVLAGALAVKDSGSAIWAAIRADRDMAGAVLGPFEAWLLLRGMRTLPLRVERMSENAQKLAEYLSDHPSVETVLYPYRPRAGLYPDDRGLWPSAVVCCQRRGTCSAGRCGASEALSPRHITGRGREPCRASPHHRAAHRYPRRAAAPFSRDRGCG